MLATITSKGQITLPADVRKLWHLKPGDQIMFRLLNETEGSIEPRRKRSIFERFDELQLPAIGRELTQADIDQSVALAMQEKHGK